MAVQHEEIAADPAYDVGKGQILSEDGKSFLAMAGGLLTASIGVLVLIGWYFGIDGLKTIIQNTVSMKVNTAVSFVLMGAAIAILSKSTGGFWRHFASYLAGLVVVISVATLTEYAFSLNLHIDQLLFSDDLHAIGTSYLGRMAVNTAEIFGLMGLSLIVTAHEAIRQRTYLILAFLLCFFMAYTPFVGYILGIRELASLNTYTKMAPHTAVAFMLASTASLFLPVSRDFTGRIFRATTSGNLLRRFLPFALLAPLIFQWFINRMVILRFMTINYAFGVTAVIMSIIIAYFSWLHASSIERGSEIERRISMLKDQFLFVATHEMRTPVTAIRWQAEMVEQKLDAQEEPGKIRPYLARIHENADRLTTLIGDMLNTSRLQYGYIRLDLAASNLQSCIAEAVENLQGSALESDISLNLETPATPIMAITDCRRVDQIVTNLITNAIKYNRRGGSVDVMLAANAERATITVTDNGLGLAAEDIKQLFLRFSRIESDDTKGIVGSGLGLFITRRIVTRLGGSISVTSAGRGLGSTFTVDLPLPGPLKVDSEA